MLQDLKVSGRTPSVTITTGDRMREARKSTGASQIEIAKALDVSRQTIIDWETSKRAPSKIAVLAYALATGVSSEWLLDPEGRLEVLRDSKIPHNRRASDHTAAAQLLRQLDGMVAA